MNDRIVIIISAVVGGIALSGMAFRFFRPTPEPIYEQRESSVQNDSYDAPRFSGDDIISYGRDDSSNSFRTSDSNSFRTCNGNSCGSNVSVTSKISGGKSKKSKKIGRSKKLRR